MKRQLTYILNRMACFANAHRRAVQVFLGLAMLTVISLGIVGLIAMLRTHPETIVGTAFVLVALLAITGKQDGCGRDA